MTDSVAGGATGGVIRGGDAELVEFPDGSSMRLFAEGIGTASTMTVNSATLRNGAEGANPHHHLMATELIVVLAGTVQVLVDNRVVRATAGDLAVIPAGVTHAFAAEAHQDAEILDVITPGVERFELFRHIALVARGHADPGGLLTDQSVYDAYPDHSPAWRRARDEMRTT